MWNKDMDFYLFFKKMGKNLINIVKNFSIVPKKTTADVIREKNNSENRRGKWWFNLYLKKDRYLQKNDNKLLMN